MGKTALVFVLATIVATTVPVWANSKSRPPLMAERLYAPVSSYGESQANQDWNKLVLALNIPDLEVKQLEYASERCRFDTALQIARELKKQALLTSYLRVWVKNQQQVLLACQGGSEFKDAPVLDQTAGLPARAESDFQYQLASWHFYRQEYSKALDLYRKVEAQRRAPMRPRAAYMVIRALAVLSGTESAYARIDKVLADPSLKSVHGIATNYRFILMHYTRQDYPYADGAPAGSVQTVELLTKHLRWLVNIIQADPEKSADPERAKADFADAREQLDIYFPRYGRAEAKVDWWLDPDWQTDTNRMEAVKALAPKVPLVDWMQAGWAYNLLDTDWLWALHAKNAPYWEQNRHIVAHELAKWKQTGDGGWLELALRRIHPQDPQAEALVGAAQAYFARPWMAETTEYRRWLFSLWTHVIRVRLGQGRAEEALALISGHQDFSGLRDRYDGSEYREVLDRTERWLVYTDQLTLARKLLPSLRHDGWNRYAAWRTLLATNAADFLASGVRDNEWGQDDELPRRLWGEMLNLVSSNFLEKVVLDERTSSAQRAKLSRTLLTRAIVLDASEADTQRLAVLAAKYNPEMRESILETAAAKNKLRYIELLLKTPRMRPMPLMYFERAPAAPDKEYRPAEVDVYDHSDNNWWCRYDSVRFNKQVFAEAKLMPSASPVISNAELEPELVPYLEKQQTLLDAHPYRSLINAQETAALEAIPGGPAYLSNYINQWESEAEPAQTDEARSQRAANLYRAVRTTRFGCTRDGSHAAYSSLSYKLLHTRYEDTPWAKATPYWFK